MTTTIQKEWAAVQNDTVIFKRTTKNELESAIRKHGDAVSEYEIMALPVSHTSIFV